LIAETLNGDALRIAAYLIVAVGCAFLAIREASNGNKASDRNRAVLFWCCVAAIMTAFSVGRFTELGPWLTDRGSDFAEWQGWYDERRRYQAALVRALIAAGAIGITCGVLWLVRASSRQHPLAFTAVVYLVTFVGVRAISLHQIDRVLYTDRAAGVRPNAVLELAGTALLGVAVLVALFDRPLHGGALETAEGDVS
jgi:hypothetical protein